MNIILLTLLVITGIISITTADKCHDGVDKGRASALAIWQTYEEDDCGGPMSESEKFECVCSSAWQFDNDCETMMEEYDYPGNGYVRSSFCFRDAVEKVIDQKDEYCFKVPDNCQALAESAATMLGTKSSYLVKYAQGESVFYINSLI